jgi:hypothetical protein
MGNIDKIGEPIWSSSVDSYDLTYEIDSKNER